MSDVFLLKDVIAYSTARTPISSVNKCNYITTDNILPNKTGVMKAVGLPAQDGNIPAYQKENILVANIRPYLKKIWFADKDGGCSADVLVLTVNKEFDPKFVYYTVFRDDFFIHVMNGSKGTKMPRGDKNQILDFTVPKFSKIEQQKIASVLSTLDKKIELNNRINRELELMAKTLYDYWFVQFDFPTPAGENQGKPYKSAGGKMLYNATLKREIPEGWEVLYINDIIEVKDGTHDSPKATEEGEHHLITSKNLKVEGLDFDNANLISSKDYNNINKRSQVETGDILFSMIGNIGTIYKVEEKSIKFAIKNVALYKSSQKLSYKNYLYMYLNSYDMKNYMGNVISGSIQKFIGLTALRNMPVLIDDKTILKFTNTSKHILKKQT
ncbi:MAG: restriction endonuclease subunit S [Alteromonadaceae bacterium]|nr:restriction endonuclease subunit S [Alteromonadaceae bacterium]